jgi:glycosyltransferase involved in cell wall biosynthesis
MSREHMSIDRRPHLLLFESIPTIAGGQAAMVQLASGWHDDLKLSALLPGAGPLAEALTSQGVNCLFAEQGDYTLLRKTQRDVTAYARRLPRLTATTVRIIRAHGIDMLYANSARVFAWATFAATIARRPILWHHHSLLADTTTLHLVTNVARLPAVRRIICASSSAQAQFTSVPAKTVVIPNGINTERFMPDPAARQAVRHSLGIGSDELVVGMVGDLIPLKHQDMLIEAMKMLQATPDFSPVTTLFVGAPRAGEPESGAFALELERLAGPQVRFLGRRHDIPAVLNALDLLVIASSRETGPLVLLESLACATPVISTPVGVAPDLLPPDALFPVGDARALALCLHGWLANPEWRAVAGKVGRARVTEYLNLPLFQARVLAEIKTFLP